MVICGTFGVEASCNDSTQDCMLKLNHRSKKMKKHLMITILTMGLSLPAWAYEYESERSREIYSPRLADIMIETQLRHFKLWYAGRVKNWALAAFELGQIRASFDNTESILSTIPLASKFMIQQPASELDSAIEAKDSAKFAKAFDRLTAACNSCHEAANLGFIVIREPRVSPTATTPFSDETFSPK
jgi:hypothetical protein